MLDTSTAWNEILENGVINHAVMKESLISLNHLTRKPGCCCISFMVLCLQGAKVSTGYPTQRAPCIQHKTTYLCAQAPEFLCLNREWILIIIIAEQPTFMLTTDRNLLYVLSSSSSILSTRDRPRIHDNDYRSC